MAFIAPTTYDIKIMNYLFLFGISFLAATVLPLSSEAVLAALIAADQSVMLAVCIATAGNVLGSLTTFWLGWRGGTWAEARNPRLASRIERSRRWIERWGPPVLVLGWLPVFGDLLVAGAGILRLAVWPCVVWITLGKAARYLAVAWATLALLD